MFIRHTSLTKHLYQTTRRSLLGGVEEWAQDYCKCTKLNTDEVNNKLKHLTLENLYAYVTS